MRGLFCGLSAENGGGAWCGVTVVSLNLAGAGLGKGTEWAVWH